MIADMPAPSVAPRLLSRLRFRRQCPYLFINDPNQSGSDDWGARRRRGQCSVEACDGHSGAIFLGGRKDRVPCGVH